MEIKRLPDIVNGSPADNFVKVPNNFLRNPLISFKAKGIFSLLLSNKDGWVSYIGAMRKLSTDGETSIRAGLSELEKTGYLRLFKYRDKKTKRWMGSFWVVTNTQNSFNISTHIQKLADLGYEIPILEKPASENPHVEKPDVENQGLKRLNNNNTNLNNTNTISKDIVNRVSDETQNDLNKKTPRRTRPQYIPKANRREKPPVKNILPPYVKNIIKKWNSYPDTTTHKLDIANPNKTIKSIHQYLIQLKTGKMSGLKESWIINNKIPRSFLTRKWTEKELLQGIEYLSKYSQNDYWPKDGKDNFKNLSNLLYNTRTKKSLFLKVMNNPPEKISVKMEIKHPIKTARFMKADIWVNDNKPSEYDLDRQLKSVVDFFVYLRPYVAPTEACMGYDLSHGEEPKLHTYFYDNYISFLENAPIMLKNANPQPLSSVGWAFKAYIADIWDDLPHIDSVINPVKLLEKFNRGDK